MPHSDRKNTTHAINNSGEQLLCQNTDADRCGEGEQRLWLRVYVPAAVAVAKADHFYYFSFRGTLTLKSFDEQSLDLLGSSQEDFSFVSSVLSAPFLLYPSLPSDPFPLSWTPPISISTIFRDISVAWSPQVVNLCISGHSTSHSHLLRNNR